MGYAQVAVGLLSTLVLVMLYDRLAFSIARQGIDTLPRFVLRLSEPVETPKPGTLTIQSRVFFEAVRGSGGTARLVLLPFEDHGYRARETIEHVLWEQIRWFDEHVKNAE